MQLGGWLDPQHLLNAFGLVGMGVIVFAESGLLIGLFLPGDSLLFTAGIPAAAAGRLSLPLLLPVAFLAAAAGDSVGYGFGRRAGPSLDQRDDARLFRRQHLERARRFYERLGRTIPSIDRYLLPAIAVIVGVSLLPLALEALRARRGRQRRSRSQVGGLPGGGDGS